MQPAVMDILRSSPLCVLCTCKDDIPDASLMLYLCDEEGTKMHMLTLRETNKFKNITANANVSLLVDTRGAGPGGADRAQALTVQGRASIMEDPEILILDEPFNGLDKQGQADIHELLQSLKAQGKTILLASHSAGDIGRACDIVYEFRRGKVVRMEPGGTAD